MNLSNTSHKMLDKWNKVVTLFKVLGFSGQFEVIVVLVNSCEDSV